jgi:hypothetical protein
LTTQGEDETKQESERKFIMLQGKVKGSKWNVYAQEIVENQSF